eukprot:6193858-Pleurochrysis_carterae.AAC.1
MVHRILRCYCASVSPLPAERIDIATTAACRAICRRRCPSGVPTLTPLLLAECTPVDAAAACRARRFAVAAHRVRLCRHCHRRKTRHHLFTRQP